MTLADSVLCTSLLCSGRLRTNCCVRENALIAILLAGFAQVVICHNHLSSQEEVRHALTHELIHAYDHCRSRDLDWSNCEHHACSEARPFLQSCLQGITWSLASEEFAAGAIAPALQIWKIHGTTPFGS